MALFMTMLRSLPRSSSGSRAKESAFPRPRPAFANVPCSASDSLSAAVAHQLSLGLFGDFHFRRPLMPFCIVSQPVSTSNSKEAFCMVYHTFLGKFQPTFSISGAWRGMVFKKRYRYAFLINLLF